MASDPWALVSPGVGAVAAAAFAIAFGVSGTAPPAPVVANLVLGLLGYEATSRMTMAMRPVFIKSRLFGIDLNKPSTKRDADGVLIRPYDGPQVPEAMGVIAGTVYLVCMFVFMPLPFLHGYHSWGSNVGGSWGSGQPAPTSSGSGSTIYDFPHAHMSKFLCAFLSICCMCFLGFADNVLDLRWRDKLWLPLSASLPLMIVYAVDGGGTLIVVPKLLVPWLGPSLTLGPLYYIFMICLAIFCTNSINILAGVNGLEVGHAPPPAALSHAPALLTLPDALLTPSLAPSLTPPLYPRSRSSNHHCSPSCCLVSRVAGRAVGGDRRHRHPQQCDPALPLAGGPAPRQQPLLFLPDGPLLLHLARAPPSQLVC